MRLMRAAAFCSLMCAQALSASAQADSASAAGAMNTGTLKPASLIVPGVLIAYGAVTIRSGSWGDINRPVHDALAGSSADRVPHFDDYTPFAPAVAVYVLNAAGVRGRHRLLDRTLIYALGNVIGNGAAYGLKKLKLETRPDGSDDYSFPSGHVTEAFVAAEFLRQEYKDASPLIGIAGYVVATGTAYMRLYRNEHWLCDAAVGAGLGIGGTKLAYWLYPKLRNLILPRRTRLDQVALLPAWQNNMPGISMVCRF